MKKRNLFAEIAEGFGALANERTGTQPLSTYKEEVQPVPDVTAEIARLSITSTTDNR